MAAVDQTKQTYQLVIQASTGWPSLGLRDLWEYRDLLYFMTWRDLKARYRQTALGWLWILLQPLMSMVLYTLIFGAIAQLPSDGRPYAVFTYAALLPWSFFASAMSASTNSLLSSMGLISKVYFPRLIVPLSQVLSTLVDFLISFAILLVMVFAYGLVPNWGVVLIPLFLLLAAVTGMGVGLWFSGVIVRYRDFGQVASFITRAWMYASPVVYSISIVPERWRGLYNLNPMTGVVEGFRWAMLNTGQPPDWLGMALAGLIALPVFIGGLYYYKRAERSIVDVA
jgi:lipopolysaccharide transport system permease protein